MKKRKIKFTKSWYDEQCMNIAKDIVRIRDKRTCNRCGSTKAPQCSHVISDGSDTRLSVDPLNMKILCMSCHMYWRHRNPIEAYNRYKAKFPKRLAYLEQKHKEYSGMGSITITRWEDTYTDLLGQYRKLTGRDYTK